VVAVYYVWECCYDGASVFASRVQLYC
jgi:hypothetical protein